MAGSKHQNAYAILGLNKGASPEEIKQAYVTLVKKYDPEKHTDHFMVVQSAFDKLRDPAKRAQEDVVTFDYIRGDFLFNDEEKTNATDQQIDQALETLREKIDSGAIPREEGTRKLVHGLMMRSWKKTQKKLWNDAIGTWQEVLKLDPGHRRAKNNLMHSLVTLGHSYATHELFDEAVEVWTEAVQMNPDDDALVHNLALACELAGRMNESARYWNEVARRWKAQLTREPDNEYLKACLIEVLRSHGESEATPQPAAPRAMGGPARAGQAPAATPAAGGAPAEPQQPTGRGGKSIDDYREIIKLNPDDFEAHYQVASLLMKDQQWDEAIAELTAMREKWPRNVEVLNLLGWALLNGGKVDDAFMMWRRGRTIEPKNHQITESLIKAHMAMGRTMRDQGLFTPCLVHFKALMRYLPDSDEVHYEIAKTYQKKGDERSAFQEYQKVLKLNPKHREARNGIASLKLRR